METLHVDAVESMWQFVLLATHIVIGVPFIGGGRATELAVQH